jgi:transcriptional regulator with XRE-family HTH domain
MGDIGAFVRAERERVNLTQAEVAVRARVSRRWLISTERGEHPRAEMDRLFRVLDALDITLALSGPAERAARRSPPAPVLPLD